MSVDLTNSDILDNTPLVNRSDRRNIRSYNKANNRNRQYSNVASTPTISIRTIPTTTTTTATAPRTTTPTTTTTTTTTTPTRASMLSSGSEEPLVMPKPKTTLGTVPKITIPKTITTTTPKATTTPTTTPTTKTGGAGAGGSASGGGGGGGASGGGASEEEKPKEVQDTAKVAAPIEKKFYESYVYWGFLIAGAIGGYMYATKNAKNILGFTLMGAGIGAGGGYFADKAIKNKNIPLPFAKTEQAATQPQTTTTQTTQTTNQ